VSIQNNTIPYVGTSKIFQFPFFLLILNIFMFMEVMLKLLVGTIYLVIKIEYSLLNLYPYPRKGNIFLLPWCQLKKRLGITGFRLCKDEL